MSNNVLVGKLINSIMLAEDNQAILFKCEEGDVKALCDADVCSYTWVEHIELPALGFPARVLEVQNLEMPYLGAIEGREYVKYYGCKIVTDRGEIIIDYRNGNDTNGWYGGNLSWPSDSHFYGGVHNQNVSNEVWVEVTEDI